MAWVTALAGALLAYNYVGARGFSLLVPALVGAVIAVAAARVAHARRAPETSLQRAARWSTTGGYAVLSALYAFRFAGEPYGPTGRWLPPVLCALAGVVAGAAYASPVRHRGARVRA